MGSARWHLRVVGTDFQGFEPGVTFSEQMGTKRLVRWTIERDAEDEEGDSEDFMASTPVERVVRLSEIAREVGAALCVEVLDKYERGEWPRRPKVPRTLIKDVVGITKRGIWIRMYHTVYDVTTSRGDAYLYRLEDDGTAKLVFKSSSSMTKGFSVKPSQRIVRQMGEFENEYRRVAAIGTGLPSIK